MVTFKEGWGKLYYTQHTLLSNIRQLPIIFFFDKETHTHSHTHIHTHKEEGNEF